MWKEVLFKLSASTLVLSACYKLIFLIVAYLRLTPLNLYFSLTNEFNFLREYLPVAIGIEIFSVLMILWLISRDGGDDGKGKNLAPDPNPNPGFAKNLVITDRVQKKRTPSLYRAGFLFSY